MRKNLIFLIFIAVVFTLLPMPAGSRSLEVSEFKEMYEKFARIVLDDYRKAGFLLKTGGFKEEEDGSGRGMRVEAVVEKFPQNYERYFGKATYGFFLLHGKELVHESTPTDISFEIAAKVKTENDFYTTVFFAFMFDENQMKRFVGNFDDRVKQAKLRIFRGLYGLTCYEESFYNGYGGHRVAGVSGADRLMLPASYGSNGGFSRYHDQFLTMLFKELKGYSFRFTVVENPPVAEIRIFYFPKDLTLILGEPPTTRFVFTAKKDVSGDSIEISRTVDSYGKMSYWKTISIDSQNTKEAAENTAKEIVRSIYSCASY